MEVLIVSKTRMSSDFACVGGLVLANDRFVRLLNRGRYNQPSDTDFDVGDVYNIDFSDCEQRVAPHIEDVIIRRCEYLFTIPLADVADQIIERNLISWRGHINNIFDGLLNWTLAGSGYIKNQRPFPAHSVGFWISDRNLERVDFGDRVRYRYPNAPEFRNLSYVGFQEPLSEIPTGTILRVSLSRLFPKPGSNIQAPQGFYLQLSGWYLEKNIPRNIQINQKDERFDEVIPGYHNICHSDEFYEPSAGTNYWEDVDVPREEMKPPKPPTIIWMEDDDLPF